MQQKTLLMCNQLQPDENHVQNDRCMTELLRWLAHASYLCTAKDDIPKDGSKLLQEHSQFLRCRH